MFSSMAVAERNTVFLNNLLADPAWHLKLCFEAFSKLLVPYVSLHWQLLNVQSAQALRPNLLRRRKALSK